MKHLLLPFLLFIAFSSSAQIVNIPDPYFKQFLVNYYNNYTYLDANHDGEIELSEALTIDSLRLDSDPNIVDVTGIGAFTNLKYIFFSMPNVTAYDFTGLHELRYVWISAVYSLTSLIVNGCTNLEDFNVNNCPLLTSLDLSGRTNLQKINITNCGLTNLNIQGCTSLYSIWLGTLPLTNLDASNLPNLNNYFSYFTNLDSLDISYCPNLHDVTVYDDYTCRYFNFEGSTAIDSITLPVMTGVTDMDFSSLVNLAYLDG